MFEAMILLSCIHGVGVCSDETAPPMVPKKNKSHPKFLCLVTHFRKHHVTVLGSLSLSLSLLSFSLPPP